MLVSYNRFTELSHRCALAFMLFMHFKPTRHCFINSSYANEYIISSLKKHRLKPIFKNPTRKPSKPTSNYYFPLL